jgi:hypothetical protein
MEFIVNNPLVMAGLAVFLMGIVEMGVSQIPAISDQLPPHARKALVAMALASVVAGAILTTFGYLQIEP